MSELMTPYSTSRLWFDKTGTEIIDIKDREGFNVAALYRDDADEILKRINGYEKLEQSNKELLGALKHLHHNARKSGAEMGLALDVAIEAITNAEREG